MIPDSMQTVSLIIIQETRYICMKWSRKHIKLRINLIPLNLVQKFNTNQMNAKNLISMNDDSR